MPLLLNVNMPSGAVRGVRATCLGRRDYLEAIVERFDPRGRRYFWIGGGEATHMAVPGSDTEAVDAGYVSVTPLLLDSTASSVDAPTEHWIASLRTHMASVDPVMALAGQ